MAQRELDLLRVRLPRIDADLRIGREMGALQSHCVGVRRNVVGKDADRRLTLAHEIARGTRPIEPASSQTAWLVGPVRPIPA